MKIKQALIVLLGVFPLTSCNAPKSVWNRTLAWRSQNNNFIFKDSWNVRLGQNGSYEDIIKENIENDNIDWSSVVFPQTSRKPVLPAGGYKNIGDLKNDLLRWATIDGGINATNVAYFKKHKFKISSPNEKKITISNYVSPEEEEEVTYTAEPLPYEGGISKTDIQIKTNGIYYGKVLTIDYLNPEYYDGVEIYLGFGLAPYTNLFSVMFSFKKKIIVEGSEVDKMLMPNFLYVTDC